MLMKSVFALALVCLFVAHPVMADGFADPYSERGESYRLERENRLRGERFRENSFRGEKVRVDENRPYRSSTKGRSFDANSKPQLAEQATRSSNRLDEINRSSQGSIVSESEQSFLSAVLLYIPNRVFDLVDIFKVDVGLGPAAGVVGRFSRYGQVGYRYVEPSYRLGIRGRRFPYFVERHTESGAGGDFNQTPNRYVTPYELGLGADLGVGAYVGVSFDELWDFVTGFVLYDPKQDDF